MSVLRTMVQEVNNLLSEGYEMWEGYGFVRLTEEEKIRVIETAADSCRIDRLKKDYGAACQSFFLFRRLHEMTEAEPERATLLGDYFFSRFSHHLIPIDSTRLIDLFSEYLKEDTKRWFEKGEKLVLSEYLDFVKRAASQI